MNKDKEKDTFVLKTIGLKTTCSSSQHYSLLVLIFFLEDWLDQHHVTSTQF